MITVSELKSYIKLTLPDDDALLQGFINSAISQLEELCNCKFIQNDFTEYYKEHYSPDRIYLKNTPINSIDSVQYLSDNAYTNFITGSDTISNSIENTSNYLVINRSGYSFFGRDLKIVYNGGYKFNVATGHMKILNGEKTVLGTSTLFTTELELNDYIIFDGLKRKVTAIDDDTHLTVSEAVLEDHLSSTFVNSNVPENLRQGCFERAAKLYYESGIGNNTLLKSSDEKGSYKELNQNDLINYYRVVNI